MIRRREFITLLGGAAAWPLAARAQQLSVVSILVAGSIPKIEHAGLYHQGIDSSPEPNPRSLRG
jgi:putative tryptophan/tyrosine transport system substrate-binding protein